MISNNYFFPTKGTDETDNGPVSGIYSRTITYNMYKTSLSISFYNADCQYKYPIYISLHKLVFQEKEDYQFMWYLGSFLITPLSLYSCSQWFVQYCRNIMTILYSIVDCQNYHIIVLIALFIYRFWQYFFH